MAKIVILGDSLSLPRPMENILYEDTYPHLLFQRGHEILNRSRRANDTNIQTKQENIDNDIIYVKPNIVILHLGIVDCAPRLFYRLEGKVFNSINKVFPILKYISGYRYGITKRFPKVYVSQQKFAENISNILKVCTTMNTKVIVVGIADTTLENKQRSYNFERNIVNYNQILKDKASSSYIDMYTYGEKILVEDGIHLNKNGHLELTREIEQEIERLTI